MGKKLKLTENEFHNLIKKIVMEQDGDEPQSMTFSIPDDDDDNRKTPEEHRKEFIDSITDKRAKFLIEKFEDKVIEFNHNSLSGKAKITSIGPSDKRIGFASSADDYIFSKGDGVQVIYDLIELNYKGEKVPIKFYGLISRYLPPEEEEESYRGDPVESAVAFGMEDLKSTLKYMGLYLSKVNVNPWTTR